MTQQQKIVTTIIIVSCDISGESGISPVRSIFDYCLATLNQQNCAVIRLKCQANITSKQIAAQSRPLQSYKRAD